MLKMQHGLIAGERYDIRQLKYLRVILSPNIALMAKLKRYRHNKGRTIFHIAHL